MNCACSPRFLLKSIGLILIIRFTFPSLVFSSALLIIIHLQRELLSVRYIQKQNVEILERLREPRSCPLAPNLKLPTYYRNGMIRIVPRSGFITTRLHGIVADGGIGNQLFELASLLGIALSLRRTPFFTATNGKLMESLGRKLLKKFARLIEQFEIKMFKDSDVHSVHFGHRCCVYEEVRLLPPSEEAPILKLEGNYFQSFLYFDHIRRSLREWLKPTEKEIERAEEIRSNLKRNSPFLICTHIRRGDFTSDDFHQPSDFVFTKDATEYLVRKYSDKNATVVILGNDPIWAFSAFSERICTPKAEFTPDRKEVPYDVQLTPMVDQEVDLAFSRMFCDVVLLTAPSSTFGWWLGYLAKSSAKVYYRDITQTNDKVLSELNPADYFPPEWTALRSLPLRTKTRIIEVTSPSSNP